VTPHARIRDLLRDGRPGQAATAAGWIRTRRDAKGGFSFLEVNDGSCVDNLQVLADESLPNYRGEILLLHPGASVVACGELVASPGAKQAVELRATEVRVCGLSDPTCYPLGKQRVSFERLREVAHLRPRTATFGAVARLRNLLAMAVHEFFQARDFLLVHTPVITANDCEGAGEMFRVTTLPVGNPPRLPDGQVDEQADFFGCRTGLTVSGQLEGEAYACALGRIYTFGPTFRAENSNTRRHLAEFWMIEPEMAFADLADDADLAEDFLRHLFRAVLERGGEDLDFFRKRIDPELATTLEALAAAPFVRMSYTEAVEALARSGAPFEYPVKWGMDLQSEHERWLTETHCRAPVTVTDYPQEIKAFYMRRNDDGRTVAAMDVLLPRVGEIIGGSQREDRLDLLQERMRAAGISPDALAWYGDLRRFGSVPHAGFGLGFERIVQFCSGMQNIRDAIPFPRTPGHAEF
jgi:asparaginyl-tRNA synthetase